MASKIVPTKRTVIPVLVPLEGFDVTKLVRSDPDTAWVDVIHAFNLVLGDQSGQRTVNEMIRDIAAKPEKSTGSSHDPLSLSKFTRCRWKGNAGTESLISPLHVVVQMLLMHPSTKTMAIREAAAQTSIRVASGDQNLVPEIQANAARLDGSETQRVMQADIAGTGSTTAVQYIPFEIAQQMATAMLMHNTAQHERRMAMYDREDAERTARHRELLEQNRRKAEAAETQQNVVFKERTIAGLKHQLSIASTNAQRVVIQDKLDLWSSAPTAVSYAVDKVTTTAPVPLAQAVIATGSGAINEIHLPARFDIVMADTQSLVSVEQFMMAYHKSSSLNHEQLKVLGGRIARAHDSLLGGSEVKVFGVAPGSKYRQRLYLLQKLLTPPVSGVVSDYLYELSSTPTAIVVRGGKRKAPVAAKSGPMDKFARV